MKWNPWYVEYAHSNRLAPEIQYARDRTRYPGYPMLGYSQWIIKRWKEYRAERGLPETGRPDEAMQRDFTNWLQAEFPGLEHQTEE